MNKVTIFKYEENKLVRTMNVSGEPWFVLKDVCDVLGLSTPARVAERLDSDEVSQAHLIDSVGRQSGNDHHQRVWPVQRHPAQR